MEAIKVCIPEPELKLGPVGDIQYGAEGCDVDKLRAHIDFGMEHGWRFLGMGDYIDFASPSNRQRLVEAALYDTARDVIDQSATRLTDELYDVALSGSEDRWLGMLEGHHFHEYANGSSTDHYLAERLRAPFLGTTSFVHVYLADFPCPIRIWCSHGYGSSVTIAGKVTHLERVTTDFAADIYLEGHIHRKYGIPIDRLEAVDAGDGLRVVATTKVLGFTGSFLRGWRQGSTSPAGFPRGSYVEQKVMRAIPTGGLLISAKPVKESWGWRLDMFVSS